MRLQTLQQFQLWRGAQFYHAVTVSDPAPTRGKGSLEFQLKAEIGQLTECTESEGKDRIPPQIRRKQKKALIHIFDLPIDMKFVLWKVEVPGVMWFFSSNLPSWALFSCPSAGTCMWVCFRNDL